MKNSTPNQKKKIFPQQCAWIEKSRLFLRVSSSQKLVAAFHSSQLTLLLDIPLGCLLGQPVTGTGVPLVTSLTEASF